jgi:hypothetical protein
MSISLSNIEKKQLEDMSEEDLRDWLWEGLLAWNQPKQSTPLPWDRPEEILSPFPFNPISSLFDTRDDIIPQLQFVFNKLSPKTKSNFRNAIVSAFRSSQLEEFEYPAIRYLTLLAELLNVSEAIHIISQYWLPYLNRQDTELALELSDSIICILSSWTRTPGAIEALWDLIEAKYFETPAHIYAVRWVFQGLLNIKSNKSCRLKNLLKYLSKPLVMLSDELKDDEYLKDFANDVLDILKVGDMGIQLFETIQPFSDPPLPSNAKHRVLFSMPLSGNKFKVALGYQDSEYPLRVSIITLTDKSLYAVLKELFLVFNNKSTISKLSTEFYTNIIIGDSDQTNTGDSDQTNTNEEDFHSGATKVVDKENIDETTLNQGASINSFSNVIPFRPQNSTNLYKLNGHTLIKKN